MGTAPTVGCENLTPACILMCIRIYIYVYLNIYIPIPSMYGIVTYIWLFLMVKYGKCKYIYHTWMLWDIFIFTLHIPAPSYGWCLNPKLFFLRVPFAF